MFSLITNTHMHVTNSCVHVINLINALTDNFLSGNLKTYYKMIH